VQLSVLNRMSTENICLFLKTFWWSCSSWYFRGIKWLSCFELHDVPL